MTGPDVAVTGYLALDAITCPAGQFEAVPGGAAFYAAAAAALAGARVALIARVGAGFPQDGLDALETLGVSLSHLVRDPHPCPCSRLVDPSGLDRTSPHHRDPNWWAAQRRLMPPIAPSGCAAYVFNAMPAAALAAQLDARRQGDTVIMDTSAAFLSAEADEIAALVPRVTLFAPSREETRLMMPGLADQAALAHLVNQVGIAVQKRGADGLALRRRHAPVELRQVSCAGTIMDTTGAGDSVVGAIAAGLVAGLADPALLRLAAAVAARAIAGIGASALLQARSAATSELSTKAEQGELRR